MSNLEKRFWEKVDRSGDCWLWTASRNQSGKGYGEIGISKYKKILAHRLSWEIHNKSKVPSGMLVLHKCGNRTCVAPHHLYIGNQSQNMIDMVNHGNCHNAVLSDNDVREIRRSKEKSTVLADRYGVGRAHIRKVITGRVKSHVK